MDITVECTSCGGRFQAPSTFAGKRVKCKKCGAVFQIKASESDPGDAQDSQLDLLVQMEKSAAGEVVDPVVANQKTRIGPKNEKTLRANPDAADIPFNAPAGTAEYYGRANVMSFHYPGARQIDQWLPLGLLVLGFVIFAAIVSGQDTKGIRWIGLLRFAIPVLFYWAIIFPVTLSMLRKAGRELHYQLPPNPKLRAFAAFSPAFVMGCGFWLAGDGALMGLILGGFVGLGMSAAALWLLYRLREEELASSVAYGVGGFLLGSGIAVALVFGLNWLTLLLLTQAKATANVPASPFGPGLAWAAPPPPEPEVLIKRPKMIAPPTTVAALAPASPIVTELSSDKFTSPVISIIHPLSDVANLAVIHGGTNNAVTIEAWDTLAWKKIGTDLALSANLGQYALSVDGQELAYIDHFPKLCAKIWSFSEGSIVKRVDLNPSGGEPKLIGFSAPHRLVIHWVSVTPETAAKQQPWSIEVMDTDKQERVMAFITPPLEPGEATITLNLATQRLAVATKSNGSPVLMQYDLAHAGVPSIIPITEIDPSISVVPTGLAYSGDGKRLAVLFEYGGGAVIPTFDAVAGKEIKDLEYPTWPPTGVSTAGYSGNALSWLDPADALLVYGQSIIDIPTSKPVADLEVPGVVGQRVLSENHVELITNQGGSRHLVIATLDPAKLKGLLSPAPVEPTSAPTSAPTATPIPAATLPASPAATQGLFR